MAWSELIWLSIWTSGGDLWRRYWTFQYHDTRGISC